MGKFESMVVDLAERSRSGAGAGLAGRVVEEE
jgi:hypothetical protein